MLFNGAAIAGVILTFSYSSWYIIKYYTRKGFSVQPIHHHVNLNIYTIKCCIICCQSFGFVIADWSRCLKDATMQDTDTVEILLCPYITTDSIVLDEVEHIIAVIWQNALT